MTESGSRTYVGIRLFSPGGHHSAYSFDAYQKTSDIVKARELAEHTIRKVLLCRLQELRQEVEWVNSVLS
jgi:hypothetical protein